MKKGGGIGPLKPWQPTVSNGKVPNPIPAVLSEKDK